jgi:hypothetical protein
MARQEGGYSHEWSCFRLHFHRLFKSFFLRTIHALQTSKTCFMHLQNFSSGRLVSWGIQGKYIVFYRKYKRKDARRTCTTSGFWPRVRARALRAPVFLAYCPPNGALRAPPAHRSFAAPQK